MEVLHTPTLELNYTAAVTMAEGTKVCTRVQFEHYVGDFEVTIFSFKHSFWALTQHRKGEGLDLGLSGDGKWTGGRVGEGGGLVGWLLFYGESCQDCKILGLTWEVCCLLLARGHNTSWNPNFRCESPA